MFDFCQDVCQEIYLRAMEVGLHPLDTIYTWLCLCLCMHMHMHAYLHPHMLLHTRCH